MPGLAEFLKMWKMHPSKGLKECCSPPVHRFASKRCISQRGLKDRWRKTRYIVICKNSQTTLQVVEANDIKVAESEGLVECRWL